jgi:anti-sigma regulatory factor (Ser/Thr protein kinase)
MKEMNIEATIDNIPTVTAWVDEQLEALDCPMKAQMQIDIAIDELFSNIARYAYNPETGPATVRVEVVENPMAVVITFIDKGIPYDPLKQEDPNTHLPAEEREIGGLGIFMVKKTMDDITYEYKDGQNILTIKKNI